MGKHACQEIRSLAPGRPALCDGASSATHDFRSVHPRKRDDTASMSTKSTATAARALSLRMAS